MDTKLINKIADLHIENSELREEIKKLKKDMKVIFFSCLLSLIINFLFIIIIVGKFL